MMDLWLFSGMKLRTKFDTIYLFYSSCQRNCYKTIIKNKVYTLLLPLLTWIIVSRFGLLFVNLFIKHQIMNFNISSIIFSFLHGLIYNFWFLKTIFFSSMLIIFVKRFFSDKIFIHLLIFLILLFTPPVADSIISLRFRHGGEKITNLC